MEISFGPDFISSVNELTATDGRRVWKSVEKFSYDHQSPSLNLEQVKSTAGKKQKRLWTIRASRELRVLLAGQGPTWILIRAGHHDEIYSLADRSAFAVPVNGAPSLVPIISDTDDLAIPPQTNESTVPPLAPHAERSVLEHWKDSELSKAGFSKDEIKLLREASTLDDLVDVVWPAISDENLERVFECSEQSPDGWLQGQLIADEKVEAGRFRDAIVEYGALAGLSPLLTQAEFQRLLSAPIEDWMIFLHPDQRALVERHFNGPARVRGSAGTGKTVVALHRAAALAKRFANQTNQTRLINAELKEIDRQIDTSNPESVAGKVEALRGLLETNPDNLAFQAVLKTEEASLNKHLTRKAELEKEKRTLDDTSVLGTDQPQKRILFTTFISTLPPVFENLYKRLPTAVDSAVEFINVDKLAGRVCRQEGKPPKRDPSAVSKAFEQALKAVVREDTPLHRADLPRGYLQDEVTRVLKGRGIDSLDEYLDMERTGRKTRFTAAMRKQAWELREDWDRRLSEAGVEDFSDVIRRARDLARQRTEPLYHAAIVDESQDLTLVGLQLIRALVSGSDGQDRSDALFIVGDGAQKIYPGGFTLAQAGINVRGTSTILRVNYRNTREIIDVAMACAGSEPVNDLGDEYNRGDTNPETVRGGIKPCLVRAESFEAQVAYVVKQAKRLHEQNRAIGLGDIGVFAFAKDSVDRAFSLLEAVGLPCQRLDWFLGHSTNAIKVGTFHRAKGLEFKVVFLLDISDGAFPRTRKFNQTEAEYEEQKTLDISLLFVAMTRARDMLFVLCSKNPHTALIEARDYLEEEVP